MKSLVLAVPADLQHKANAVAVALGHDVLPSHTYSVPISATGADPATHFGCHTWATDGFVDAINACRSGASPPPAPWGAVGLTEDDVIAVCSALVVSVSDENASPLEHFETTLAANGLRSIKPQITGG